MATVAAILDHAFERHQGGLFDEAGALYRRALAVQPDARDALHRHGLLLAQLGDLEAGARLVRRAIAVDGTPVEPHVNRAKLLRAMGRPAEAARAFATAAALCPGRADALNGLGHARRDLGDMRAAATAFGRAARCGGGAPSLHQQGMALEAAGRREDAVDVLMHAAALDPESGPVAVRIGALLLALGDIERAGRWYRHALTLRPGHNESLRGLVAADAMSGNEAAAARGKRRADALLPERT
ncbi:tetratricopeptide repeat protein [Azospirillum soli]|uniref:tetratricopeptide repeat protein n=1 Tax=Azospirillum soli TaxID=1304799 RepID=UPI001AE31D17|nr:tetratricopeptide repeat protein [Azospirillum soli]MBP2315851.1 tetratricopeptide (TPR) repeat protein [Azospirillum soli]